MQNQVFKGIIWESSDFYVETARTKTKFNSFKIKGITLWNQIDDSLKLKKSMPSFKYAVKKTLFDKY